MIIHVVNGYNVKLVFCNHSCCAWARRISGRCGR